MLTKYCHSALDPWYSPSQATVQKIWKKDLAKAEVDIASQTGVAFALAQMISKNDIEAACMTVMDSAGAADGEDVG